MMVLIDFIFIAGLGFTIYLSGYTYARVKAEIIQRRLNRELVELHAESAKLFSLYLQTSSKLRAYQNLVASGELGFPEDAKNTGASMTWAEAKKIIQLCHPDKQPAANKAAANEVCQMLIERFKHKR